MFLINELLLTCSNCKSPLAPIFKVESDGILTLVILLLPIVTSFDTSTAEAAALYPIITLLEPVVKLFVPLLPAKHPKIVFSIPVETLWPALKPTAVLLLLPTPASWVFKASTPIATFLAASSSVCKALYPTTTL